MATLIKQTETLFRSKFKREPLMVKSPGRVNLMGDHTDYNDGFVLPAAIQNSIIMAIAANDSELVHAYSVDMKEEGSLDLSHLEQTELHWLNYIKGVVSELQKAGAEVPGFDLVFGGDIPIGAGLSSSAALEGALLTGLNSLFDLQLSTAEMARIGQLTEHRHIGVNCGIMDQFINLHGEEHKALKLDCRSLEYEHIPFDHDEIKIVLCNSKVSHNLASSEYNVRRSQCEAGVEVLKQYDPQIVNLRDVNWDLLEKHKEELDPVSYRRCKFVLEENQRVLDACNDLKHDDLISFGKRMYESHEGLSKDYEVSCKELDILVEIAKSLPGLIGCRMMGGGFGGCTINLVKEKEVPAFIEAISKRYKEKTGQEAEVYATQINGGARTLEATI